MSLRIEKKRRVRNEILDVAGALIARQGFDGTSMRAIAQGADVSHQTLYNYFPTKARLAAALLTRDTDALTARLERLLQRPEMPLPERFRAAMKLVLQVVDEDARPLWREVAALSFREPDEFLPLYDDYFRQAQQRMRRAIHDARDRGDLLASVDAELLAQTILSIVDHAKLVFILFDDLKRDEFAHFIARQIDLVLDPYLAPR